MSIDTIQERGGKLFVVFQDYDFDKPVLRRFWYPTDVSAKEYPELVGKTVHYNLNGLYGIPGHYGATSYIRLINNGETKPEFVDEEPVPSPKRIRSELRWRSQRWEKLDKRKGWIIA